MISRSYNKGLLGPHFLNIVEIINHYVKFYLVFISLCTQNDLIIKGDIQCDH